MDYNQAYQTALYEISTLIYLKRSDTWLLKFHCPMLALFSFQVAENTSRAFRHWGSDKSNESSADWPEGW